MSQNSVITDLAQRAPHLRVVVATEPTPTVETAAAVHGVAPSQIAKTLAFWVGDKNERRVVLIVAGGTARMDNKKLKAQFGSKCRMLNAEEVMQWTSHPVGGVCPFGLPQALTIYLDTSLRQHEDVLPAAGCTHSMVRVAVSELAQLTAGQWVEVAASE